MTDQKFFGMWDGTEWVIPPVLQYDGALGGVLAHSKNGDYERAKTALLTYYKGRPTAINFTRNDNNPLHVEMAAEKIFSFIQNDGAAGKVTVSPQWGSYSVPLSTLAGAYFLLDADMDGSFAEVYSKEHHSEKPAVLEAVIDGERRTFPLIGDTYISAGENRANNYGGCETLYVREAAGAPDVPVGTDTARAYFRFDIGTVTGEVSSITLKFYGRSSAGDKKIYVFASTNERYFDEHRLTWEKHYPQAFNFKETGYVWKSAEFHETFWGVEFEWLNFASRLYHAGWLVAEGQTAAALELGLSLLYSQESGVYPRILEGGWRTEFLCVLFFGALERGHMTEAVLTPLLKYIYSHALELKDVLHPTANWNSAVRVGFLRICEYFPELVPTEWRHHARERVKEMYGGNIMNPDGSYTESCSGYIGGVIEELKLCLSLIADRHDPAYLFLLEQYKRLTTFFFNMTMSYGYTPPWGDGGRADIKAFAARENAFYPNPHFAYFATDGAAGEKPNYTSILYKDKAIAFLRSGWDREDFSAMFHADLGGNHSHADDLSLDVYAYGKALLTDAGCGTYSPGCMLAKTRHKTISHNTVEIDGKDQYKIGARPGVAQKMTLTEGKEYDVIECTSDEIYPGFTVSRRVVFVHNAYWVVTDVITPSDDAPHTYRQLWHPDAENHLCADTDAGIARTNFRDGANLMILPMYPENAVLRIKKLYMFHPKLREVENDYAEYCVENAVGTQRFDTVLYPFREGETPRDAEELLREAKKFI